MNPIAPILASASTNFRSDRLAGVSEGVEAFGVLRDRNIDLSRDVMEEIVEFDCLDSVEEADEGEEGFSVDGFVDIVEVVLGVARIETIMEDVSDDILGMILYLI